ncbi:amino acid deaminase/aldolase [Actinocrinis sp.]|uniref:amino acid deaminase/aldolase n=1 Tax=Actinocrinis sp. TaxID=1920516 RepID=UPI002C8A0AB8|nr:amino acid deaminase/aldolase [Actinocrinis sp.]HXR71970.1 amino acid deaminase/aldolase [Actinocrinis sp.]
MTDLDRLNHATEHLDPPLAVVDLAALRYNATELVRRAGGKRIRVATKSVRSREVLRAVLALDGFRGLLAFTLPEALWLAASGFDDILVGYPTVDRVALRRLAADARTADTVTLMIDSIEQLDLIEKATADVPDAAPIRVCVDIDASWRPLGGRLRIGARRSPLHSPASVAAVAREAADRHGFRLIGLMAYEAQIAGVGDAPPGRPARGLAVRVMQRGSAAELAERRAAIVAAVKEIAQLEFVNGGGTGSVERTAAEEAVTEIGAGSGLFLPRLFDGYRAVTGRPAALFALPVVRRPGPGVVTVLGGGYIASGPPGTDRLPQPYLPSGLHFDSQEAAGEVQTPLLGAAADNLAVGDRVWFRHAKAGELCERFGELHLIQGDSVTATVPTYRGEGRTFL